MQDPNLYGRIKAAVIAVLQALNLPGLAGVNSELAEDEMLRRYPCLTVTEDGCTVKILGGDTRFRDTLFPLRVFVETSATRTQVQTETTWLNWLKTVTDRFHQQSGLNKLPAVPEVFNVDVKPLTTWDFKDKRYQRVRSGLELGFMASELSGPAPATIIGVVGPTGPTGPTGSSGPPGVMGPSVYLESDDGFEEFPTPVLGPVDLAVICDGLGGLTASF